MLSSTFIDELSYRKRHHYLTVVVDHDRRRVVWAGKGRSAETLEAFFDLLGPAGCERIELVTADLASSCQRSPESVSSWTGPAATTCRGRMSGHRQQEPVWTSVRGAGVRAVSPAKRGRSEATRLCRR